MAKYFFFFAILSLRLHALTGTWNVDAAGNWNNGANWTSNPAFPNAVDDVANVTFDITGNRVVTLGQNITIGSLWHSLLFINPRCCWSAQYDLCRRNPADGLM